jgi:glyoxylase-like metal-dependent hydrolase (beta-lactamase superfamily II)
VAIDPAWDGDLILTEADRRGWEIKSIWVTHAHFDHLAGAAAIAKAMSLSTSEPAKIALHPADLDLWRMQGGAAIFGMHIEPAPDPTILLADGQTLQAGWFTFEVRHTPGHTPGHVVFYCAAEKVVFCGDVIFSGSIGRTDLPGGNFSLLIGSIRRKILSLPDDTRLLSGHGAETTVGQERLYNPFL